ncbi:helix-turn-helix domain-containing protein [Curtobacterium sp. MCBD17_035]|uniref:helix-turn-helix domain-containing protein n=1 Tax=Curtobacterium sp. MCBD17_035 TaxID=2175673 RepID=UPI000DA7ED86|nr:helix-turn-helix domain-containing protein [Curtobacterium sp. MCBD17_035]WIB68070.1 helix-turn-helix domain-containing protein [Curtobacterium sp. MCBD17_035]
MTLDDIRDHATIALWPDAGVLLGLSKNSTYAGARSGEIPTIRIGSRYLVPVRPFLRLVGADDEQDPRADAAAAGVETQGA